MNNMIKIICQVNKSDSSVLFGTLKALGITDVQIEFGRSIVLREKKKLLIPVSTILEEDPVDMVSFYISPAGENTVIETIIEKLHLDLPGRGSIYSKKIKLYQKQEFKTSSIARGKEKNDKTRLSANLMGICCIVQRGEGNTIARKALDMGTMVPCATFGVGTGLRNKLGLLRITIPAEKEVIHLIVGENDVDETLETLIEAGKLDFPGKGFIYIYPVEKGCLNTHIFRGQQKHAASMEQVIVTLDELVGNTEWRRRSYGPETQGGDKGRKFITKVTDVTLICNEGSVMDLVKTAMSYGASGATVSKQRYKNLSDNPIKGVSPARESANMIVAEDKVENLINALQDYGAFKPEISATIEMKSVLKAFTYMGK